jgi:hypothetical protein
MNSLNFSPLSYINASDRKDYITPKGSFTRPISEAYFTFS